MPSSAREPDGTRVYLAHVALTDGKTVESVGAHYSPAAWRSEEGGYVGHIDWRDAYGMGSRSYCGHKHRKEQDARDCISALLRAARKEGDTSHDDH